MLTPPQESMDTLPLQIRNTLIVSVIGDIVEAAYSADGKDDDVDAAISP